MSASGSSSSVIIINGLSDTKFTCGQLFTGIYIPLFIPGLVQRRLSDAISKLLTDSSICPKDLQQKMKDELKSSSNLSLFCDSIKSLEQMDIICIGLDREVLKLIQTVYPPSEFLSYDIIETANDALSKYPEYLELLQSIRPASSSSFSPTSGFSFSAVEISKIPLPNGRVIFLGNAEDAANCNLLNKLGIRFILNVSHNIPFPDFYKKNNFDFLRIDIKDCASITLEDYFTGAFEFINKALDSSKCILIHCQAGISRSPSFVIGYLMYHFKYTFDYAFQYVKKYRSIIQPNLSFHLQLQTYEDSIHYTNL